MKAAYELVILVGYNFEIKIFRNLYAVNQVMKFFYRTVKEELKIDVVKISQMLKKLCFHSIAFLIDAYMYFTRMLL